MSLEKIHPTHNYSRETSILDYISSNLNNTLTEQEKTNLIRKKIYTESGIDIGEIIKIFDNGWIIGKNSIAKLKLDNNTFELQLTRESNELRIGIIKDAELTSNNTVKCEIDTEPIDKYGNINGVGTSVDIPSIDVPSSLLIEGEKGQVIVNIKNGDITMRTNITDNIA